MSNQPQPETSELLGDWHPLVEQLGSSEGLVSLSTASHALRLKNITSTATLLQFLEAYQAQVLIPFELPAIQRAFRHASRNEARELVEFDGEVGRELALRPFFAASRRVGQAQIRRLRPLRDHRFVQRYLRSVESGLAQGWHTLVYGITLSVYSLPVLQGLVSYERQTLLGFIHAVSRALHLSEADCRGLIDQLSPTLPRTVEPILGDGTDPRHPSSF
ncbi:MAG: hypothetical protein RJA22_436 [Verrucomicrobiota bacterium]